MKELGDYANTVNEAAGAKNEARKITSRDALNIQTSLNTCEETWMYVYHCNHTVKVCYTRGNGRENVHVPHNRELCHTAKRRLN